MPLPADHKQDSKTKFVYQSPLALNVFSMTAAHRSEPSAAHNLSDEVRRRAFLALLRGGTPLSRSSGDCSTELTRQDISCRHMHTSTLNSNMSVGNFAARFVRPMRCKNTRTQRHPENPHLSPASNASPRAAACARRSPVAKKISRTPLTLATVSFSAAKLCRVDESLITCCKMAIDHHGRGRGISSSTFTSWHHS